MPLTARQANNTRAAQAAQIGITPEAYQARLDALRGGAYTAAMFDPAHGNRIPTSTMEHWQGGGSTAGLLGDKYEFLDRGGLGAPATGMQHGVTPASQQFGKGFAGVSPGLQAPTPSMSVGAPAPAGARPAQPQGFQGVQQPRGSTDRIRQQQASRGIGTRMSAAQR